MSQKLSPALKGFLTAIMMVTLALVIDAKKDKVDPRLQYIIFLTYAAGIIWTLVIYRGSTAFAGNFAGLFSQGFKCFIVVSLVMVIFTGLFIKAHPEYAEQQAIATKEYFIREGDKTPGEIDDLVTKAKKQYSITIISVSIFRYLIFGAIVTAATAALLTRRK